MSLPWWIKLLLTGAIVTGASELAKHSGRLGALVMVLPWITLSTLFWLESEGQGQLISPLLRSGFWYLLPSLPLFLVLPWMLDRGYGIWTGLGASCLLAVTLFLAEQRILGRVGVEL